MAFLVNIGDKVAYSAKFLESIGMLQSDMSHAKGIVKKIETWASGNMFATIDWEDEDCPKVVNVANLAIVGPNLRYVKD